jgi:hypothetical protein
MGMHFEELQIRLLAVLRCRLRNGEMSERGLAFLTGISQPHIHNVLKGERILSLSATDQILKRLRLTVLDLLEPGDFSELSFPGVGKPAGSVEVPVLEGWLGPGLPLPTEPSPVDRYPFPASLLAAAEQPVAARLAADPRMDALFLANDLVLLDQSPARRMRLQSSAAYVVNRRGEGVVRRVSLERSDLLVLGSAGRRRADGYEVLPLGGVHLLDVVRARVIWIGRLLDPR